VARAGCYHGTAARLPPLTTCRAAGPRHIHSSTNWWLEELIEAGKPLPQEAPAPEARDWFL